MTVVANEIDVAQFTRKPLPFGVTSVVDTVENGGHWQFGGVVVEGDACVILSTAGDPCDPPVTKDSQEVHQWWESTPFRAYLLNTCRTVGRMSDAESRTRAAFLGAENAAIDQGVATALAAETGLVTIDPGALTCLGAAVGALEQHASAYYGGQPTILMPRRVAPLAFADNLLVREGSHLETQTGSLVGLYSEPAATLATAVAPIYVVGGMRVYKGGLAVAGPVIDLPSPTNEFLVLVERTYAMSLDCLLAATNWTPEC